jgi:hypothetical protein
VTAAAPQAGERVDGLPAVRLLAKVAAIRALGGLGGLRWTFPVPARARASARFKPKTPVFLGRARPSPRGGCLVSFLIAPVGEGTRELCRLRPGEAVWLLGPLGNGFDLGALTAGAARLVIVAGGVGAAPFPLLLTRIGPEGGRSPAPTAQVLVLLGFRDAAQAAGAQPVTDAAAALQERGVASRAEVVTEDGSRGRAEMVIVSPCAGRGP